MARARGNKGSEKPADAAESTELKFRVEVEINEDTPTYYANYIEVQQNPNEFGLSIVRVPTKLSQQRLDEVREAGVIRIEPTVQLVLPSGIIPGLIEALTNQLQNFQALTKRTEVKADE